MDYTEISHQIINLKNADLQLRSQLIHSGELWDGYHPKMEKLHIKNAETLQEIMTKIGYPTISKVGKEASDAAWLIIQHAISRPSFMKNSLVYLKKAVEQQDANPYILAYLQDRIAILEGRQQLYGIQFDWDESGQLSPLPYDDIAKVNQRRKKLGMNTLSEQTAIIRTRAKNENEKAPQNLKERKKEYDKWRKKVGWI